MRFEFKSTWDHGLEFRLQDKVTTEFESEEIEEIVDKFRLFLLGSGFVLDKLEIEE